MWKLKNPNYGDHIRVDRGMYFHHGIYESDDVVVCIIAVSGEVSWPIGDAKWYTTSSDS